MTVDMSINQGIHCSPKAIEVLRGYTETHHLREYTDPDNQELLETLAAYNDVGTEHVFLDNGSGPILKATITETMKQRTQSSLKGIVQYLLFKRLSTPIITASFTYKKIPPGAERAGIPIKFVEIDPEQGFRLDVGRIEERLREGDGLVYFVNPNNPTGKVLLSRDQIASLTRRFPDSLFWIDEVYHEYVDPSEYTPAGSLVSERDNLIVSRSFSFAWGMASLRIGYALAAPRWIELMNKKATPYRIGKLQQEVALAALRDSEFLPWLREENDTQRELLREGLDALPGVATFPSQTNFVLCELTDGTTAEELYDTLMDLGFKIKLEVPFGACGAGREYFRISVGLPEENQAFLETMQQVFGQPIPARPIESEPVMHPGLAVSA